MVAGMVAGAWLFAVQQQGFFHTAVAPWRLALGGLLVLWHRVVVSNASGPPWT